jgi:hypothetical protein
MNWEVYGRKFSWSTSPHLAGGIKENDEEHHQGNRSDILTEDPLNTKL